VVVYHADLWILQSSTNLDSASFVDVTNAVGPFTNSVTDGQRFFRLRK